MASSVDMASKTPPLIDGKAIATVAASHNTGIKTFGLMPSRRPFSADWPEVELRADMASSLPLSLPFVRYGLINGEQAHGRTGSGRQIPTTLAWAGVESGNDSSP